LKFGFVQNKNLKSFRSKKGLIKLF